MPKQVDHEQRRTEIAEALWQVVARDGIEAATVRNVAAQAGVSAGQVQHYFSTKHEMLRFALQRVGGELATRLIRRVSALPQPAQPGDVVRVVLLERLPIDPAHRVYVQAMLAWLGETAPDPELAAYMVEGHRRLRDYLAEQIRLSQRAGHTHVAVDPAHTADGLLALTDGLTSHVLQHIHSTESALTVLDEHLARIFGHLPHSEVDAGLPG